jgi:hypothetical protein
MSEWSTSTCGCSLLGRTRRSRPCLPSFSLLVAKASKSWSKASLVQQTRFHILPSRSLGASRQKRAAEDSLATNKVQTPSTSLFLRRKTKTRGTVGEESVVSIGRSNERERKRGETHQRRSESDGSRPFEASERVVELLLELLRTDGFGGCVKPVKRSISSHFMRGRKGAEERDGKTHPSTFDGSVLAAGGRHG